MVGEQDQSDHNGVTSFDPPGHNPLWLWMAFWIACGVASGLLIAVYRQPPSTFRAPRGQWVNVDRDSVMLTFVGEGGLYMELGNAPGVFFAYDAHCLHLPTTAPCAPFKSFAPDSLVATVGGVSRTFHPVRALAR